MRFERADERYAGHRVPPTSSLPTDIRPRRQESTISMSQTYSIRQLRKRGDLAAKIHPHGRNLAQRSVQPPGVESPLRPRSRSGHQHTRLSNRNACDQHRPGPKHTPRCATSNTREPACNFWAVSQAESARNATQRRRFPRSEKLTANNSRQEPPRSPGPMAKSTPISSGTAQKSRGRDRGRGRNPKHRGAHSQAKPRQPMRM